MNIAELGKSPHADPLVKTILEHDLARHIVELDAYGFTVIPPEKLGTSPGFAERLRDAILNTYQKRHDVTIDDWRTADLEVPPTKAWQLVDEDDVITEAVLNPVALTMARWHCGQSALLGGHLLHHQAAPRAKLPRHPQRHPRRAPAPGRLHPPRQHQLGPHRLRIARRRPHRVRARLPTAGAARPRPTRPTSGSGTTTKTASTNPSRSRPRPARSPSGAATPGTAP